MTPTNKSVAHRIGSWLVAAALMAVIPTIAAAQGSSKKFIMHDAPKPIAAIRFEDGHGQTRSLSDFRGKVVLLNIWATWCVPCRKEMLALDRLQAILGGPHFEIVALSIDRGGMEVVRKFFAEVGVRNLTMYLDTSGKASRELGAVGLPTTLLVDRQGREIGRLIGPAEWDAPEMVEFVKCIISRDDVAQSRKESKPSATPSCNGHSQ
jgi:thiol-disulfide isomerase/thioredoxin